MIDSDPWGNSALSEKELTDRGNALASGEAKAESTALAWQQIADGLADMVDQIKSLTPWLPNTEDGQWFMSTWPDAGVEVDAVPEHLRAALAGAYAFAGAYSRAAGQLGEAILAHQHDAAARTGTPVSEIADTAGAQDTEVAETAGA